MTASEFPSSPSSSPAAQQPSLTTANPQDSQLSTGADALAQSTEEASKFFSPLSLLDSSLNRVRLGLFAAAESFQASIVDQALQGEAGGLGAYDAHLQAAERAQRSGNPLLSHWILDSAMENCHEAKGDSLAYLAILHAAKGEVFLQQGQMQAAGIEAMVGEGHLDLCGVDSSELQLPSDTRERLLAIKAKAHRVLWTQYAKEVESQEGFLGFTEDVENSCRGATWIAFGVGVLTGGVGGLIVGGGITYFKAELCGSGAEILKQGYEAVQKSQAGAEFGGTAVEFLVNSVVVALVGLVKPASVLAKTPLGQGVKTAVIEGAVLSLGDLIAESLGEGVKSSLKGEGFNFDILSRGYERFLGNLPAFLTLSAFLQFGLAILTRGRGSGHRAHSDPKPPKSPKALPSTKQPGALVPTQPGALAKPGGNKPSQDTVPGTALAKLGAAGEVDSVPEAEGPEEEKPVEETKGAEPEEDFPREPAFDQIDLNFASLYYEGEVEFFPDFEPSLRAEFIQVASQLVGEHDARRMDFAYVMHAQFGTEEPVEIFKKIDATDQGFVVEAMIRQLNAVKTKIPAAGRGHTIEEAEVLIIEMQQAISNPEGLSSYQLLDLADRLITVTLGVSEYEGFKGDDPTEEKFYQLLPGAIELFPFILLFPTMETIDHRNYRKMFSDRWILGMHPVSIVEGFIDGYDEPPVGASDHDINHSRTIFIELGHDGGKNYLKDLDRKTLIKFLRGELNFKAQLARESDEVVRELADVIWWIDWHEVIAHASFSDDIITKHPLTQTQYEFAVRSRNVFERIIKDEKDWLTIDRNYISGLEKEAPSDYLYLEKGLIELRSELQDREKNFGVLLPPHIDINKVSNEQMLAAMQHVVDGLERIEASL